MLKSKLLLTAFCVGVFSLGVNAQAEDILSILERNTKAEQVESPKTIPYIYTVKIEMFGKEGKGELIEDDDESGDLDDDESGDLDDGDADNELAQNQESEEKKTDAKPRVQNLSAVLEINPTLTGDARVKILSHKGDLDSDEFKDVLSDFTDEKVTESDLADNFWCDNNISTNNQENFADSITVISETDDEAIIKPDLENMVQVLFSSNPDEDGPSDGASDSGGTKKQKKLVRRMLKRMDAQVVLNKPDGQMKEMKIWMTRSMRVALIAKVKKMSVHATCEVAPNGLRYQARQDFDMGFSALGKQIEQNVHRRITDLRPLP